MVAPPAATADGLLAGPALQAAEGRQNGNGGEGHGIRGRGNTEVGWAEVGRQRLLMQQSRAKGPAKTGWQGNGCRGDRWQPRPTFL